VLEAMASGLPAIVSRVAGASEIITDDSIVLEDPLNLDEVTAAVQKLEDPAVRKAMGEAARRKALEHPLSRGYDEYLKLYDEVRAMKKDRP
jgi:glycosyltransferase involved in cell wall biosynthesis